jgi:hypothetical protein
VAPIGPLTAALIASIPSDTDLFFPAGRGDKVFGGWSKQKELFDKQIADAGYIVAPLLRRGFCMTFVDFMPLPMRRSALQSI